MLNKIPFLELYGQIKIKLLNILILFRGVVTIKRFVILVFTQVLLRWPLMGELRIIEYTIRDLVLGVGGEPPCEDVLIINVCKGFTGNPLHLHKLYSDL